jgi:hypothetical protein
MTISPSKYRLGALCALLLLGACGIPEPSNSPRNARNRTDIPLVARIETRAGGNTGGYRFYLSRPAHVALFEVVPGRGVGLLYPTVSFDSRQLTSGMHLAQVYNTFFRASYLPYGGSGIQPRYILLIASDQPLHLDEIRRSPYALRNIMGLQHFASYNPYNTMDALAESVLPAMVGDDGWASDVYVEWPNALPQQQYASLVRMQCPSGRVIAVPFDMMLLAMRACDDAGTSVKYLPPPLNPADTTEVVLPPRRTRPVADGNGEEPTRTDGRQYGRDAETPREPRVARPRPESSEPRARGSAPRVVSVPRAEPRSEPRAEPRSEPRPVRSSEPRPESRPAPNSEPRPESRPAPSSEPRPTPKSEPRPAPETRVEPSAPRVERTSSPEQR